MKIFANRFALELDILPPHGHFRFESFSLDKIRSIFRDEKQFFQGQTFYCLAANEKDLQARIQAFVTDKNTAECKNTLILYFDEESDRQSFLDAWLPNFRLEEAAGGLLTNDMDELLMIVRDGLWDLPKGKVEKGESYEEAAWREVMEETGIDHHETHDFRCKTFHIFERKGSWRLKATWWYDMKAEGRGEPKGQAEEGISQVTWVPMHELRKSIPETYPQIMELVRITISERSKTSS